MHKIDIFRLAEQIHIDTEDTQRVLSALSDENVLVIGEAGSGKTEIYQKLIAQAHEQKDCHILEVRGIELTEYRIYDLYDACILSNPKAGKPKKLADKERYAKEALADYAHLKHIFMPIDNAQDLQIDVVQELLSFQEKINNLRLILFSSTDKFASLGFKKIVLQGLSADEFTTYMQALAESSSGKIAHDAISHDFSSYKCFFLDILCQLAGENIPWREQGTDKKH